MPSLGMDSGRWVLAAADVEAQVMDAPDSAGDETEAGDSVAGQVSDALWTLARFRERFGHGWAAGRVEISADFVEFRPRQADDSGLPIAVQTRNIRSVEAVSRVFTKLVRVTMASGHVIVLRCRAPQELAEQLRSAIGALRAAAA